MKKLCVLLAVLCLILCACGGAPAGDAAPAGEETTLPPAERTGLSFTQDAVWRATKTVLQTPNTVEAWVKLPAVQEPQILVTTAGNGMSNMTLSVTDRGAPKLEWVFLVNNEPLPLEWVFSKVDICTDTWTHLAVVRDGKAGSVQCYVDGQLKDEIKAKFDKDLTPARPYCIGGDHSAKNASICQGQISSVAVFSSVRTPEQIAADMVKPEGEDLLAAYDLSAVTGETVADGSSLGNELIRSVRWFTEKEPVTDYAYSMVVVGDTQTVAKGSPELFPEITKFIADNVEAKNIKFVMGMGDITNDSTEREWAAAREAYSLLDGVVPYSLVRGNEGHDSLEGFYEYFPYSKYKDTVSGSMGADMRNVYYNFEVGDVKYMVMVLDSSPDDSEVQWASQVIAAHPDRNVILTTHVFLYRDGTPLGAEDLWPMNPNNGDELWEKLVSKHENIVLMLCGHDPCSQLVTVQTPGDHGNIVTQMLVDGQEVDSTDGRCGLVAILYFSEDGKNVSVEYYSTIRKQFFLTENQFSFTLDTVD